MKSGKCPKCGSTNVRRSGPPSMWKQSSGAIPIGGGGLGGHVLPQWYVCTGCGYTEQYIDRETDREKLKKKWKLATERDG